MTDFSREFIQVFDASAIQSRVMGPFEKKHVWVFLSSTQCWWFIEFNPIAANKPKTQSYTGGDEMPTGQE